MNLKDIRTLQIEVHQWSEECGHHKGGKTTEIRAEKLMMVIGELAKALEAHRCGRILGSNYEGGAHHIVERLNHDITSIAWLDAYRIYVKDFVGDEIADAYIRFVDWCNYFDQVIYVREYTKDSTNNIGYDLLRLTHYAMQCYHNEPGKGPGYFIAALEAFCQWWNIDLQWHVKMKMRFNHTRDHLHGKNY